MGKEAEELEIEGKISADGDIEKMINKEIAIAKEALAKMEKATKGEGIVDVNPALDALLGYASSGPVKSFYEENCELSDKKKSADFLKKNKDLSTEEKELMIGFVKLLEETKVKRKEFWSFIKIEGKSDFIAACDLIRFEQTVSDLVNDEDLNNLDMVFDDLNGIFDENDGKKANPKVVKENQYVAKFFDPDGKIKNEAQAKLRLYDKYSKTYADEYVKFYDEFKKGVEKSTKLNLELTQNIEEATSSEVLKSYFNSYIEMLGLIISACEKAMEISDKFSEKTRKAPYGIMSFGNYAQNCVWRHHLVDFNDFKKDGSNYQVIFSNISRKLISIISGS